MKTVDLTPTWNAALFIVTTCLERSVEDVKTVKGRKLLLDRIQLVRDTFRPLCDAIDKQNDDIHNQRNTREVKTCSCGCNTLTADLLCTACGNDPMA